MYVHSEEDLGAHSTYMSRSCLGGANSQDECALKSHDGHLQSTQL